MTSHISAHTPPVAAPSFNDLLDDNNLLLSVADAGYLIPTPIQHKAIPFVLQNKDLIGVAQTGTGKTASFTLPIIQKLTGGRARARMPRSLILEPTRELAHQVHDSFLTYGKRHKLSTALLIGGVSFQEQKRALDRGVDVLIATPGRLLDQCERGGAMLIGAQIFVIDEADRMLDMGFIPDIERIIKMTPPKRQTLLFSATMPAEIRRLANSYMKNPQLIQVDPPASPAETVSQFTVRAPNSPEAKRALLAALLRQDSVTNAIVFCNAKREVGSLASWLKRKNFNAASLHGDMDQYSRLNTLNKFRDNQLRILVASDVAARGLDISGVSHVFNYNVPYHDEDYIHRIGRTGRAGRTGVAITLVSPLETPRLEAVEALLRKPVPLLPNPPKPQPQDLEPQQRRRNGSAGRRPQRPRQGQSPRQGQNQGQGQRQGQGRRPRR